VCRGWVALLLAIALVGGLASPAEAAGGGDRCPGGELDCVEGVIAEMNARFDPLADACDHDAVFALTYLRTTERYHRAASTGTFFRDTAYVNREDAVFAQAYFDAYDAWHSGNRAATPPAWRIAFAAADSGLVTGLGNLLLGMSAHVNRDLPFVLAELGLVAPDGTSRKADHDKVNEFLIEVVEPVLLEAAARFDPTMDDLVIPGTTLDEAVAFQLLALWREQAWHNAELLVAAPTPAARAVVAAEIEAAAALEAKTLLLANSYAPTDFVLGRRAARDAYCAAHHG
jgi:hypothetical protein